MEVVRCGSCGLSWDDSFSTSWTPAPSGRCPFEYFHKYDENDEPLPIHASDIPADFEVQPLDVITFSRGIGSGAVHVRRDDV